MSSKLWVAAFAAWILGFLGSASLEEFDWGCPRLPVTRRPGGECFAPWGSAAGRTGRTPQHSFKMADLLQSFLLGIFKRYD